MTSSAPLINYININDVLCGRGGKINAYSGNVQFRALVKAHKNTYLSVRKHEKVNVARMVIDTIKNMEPPGRFLKESEDSKSWVEIPIERVLKKTKQALREPEDDQDDSAISAGVTFQSPASHLNSFFPHLPVDNHASVNHDPSILFTAQKVDEGPLLSSIQEPFAFNAHYQVTVNEVHPDTTVDLRNSEENCHPNNMQMVSANSNAEYPTELATMGDSLSSADTAPTVFVANSRQQHFRTMKNEVSSSAAFTVNSRRQYFRAMRNEATSLDTLITESKESFDEDDIMRESLVSIDVQSKSIDVQSKSIDIQSIDMQSLGDSSFGCTELIHLVGA